MASQTDTIRAKSDKLDDAFQSYANENGDGFSAPDFRGAYDYREEGYRLGEEAADMASEDRDDWIEAQTYAFPESARYLIACAADFRLAELENKAALAAASVRRAA